MKNLEFPSEMDEILDVVQDQARWMTSSVQKFFES